MIGLLASCTTEGTSCKWKSNPEWQQLEEGNGVVLHGACPGWEVLGKMPVSIVQQVGQQELGTAWRVCEWPVHKLNVEALIVSHSVPVIVMLCAPGATGPGCNANEHCPVSSSVEGSRVTS